MSKRKQTKSQTFKSKGRARNRAHRPKTRPVVSKKKNKSLSPADPADRLSKALARMIQDGLSERQAATAEGVSRSALRTFRKRYTRSRFGNGHWRIVDKRPQYMHIATKEEIRDVAVTRRSASVIGRHWNAINAFLDTNRRSFLRRFDGVQVRDHRGKKYTLETDPNVLRFLDSIGELDFKEIYAVGGGHG